MPLPNSIDAKVRLGCPRRQAAQVSPAAASTPTSLAYSRNDVTAGYGTTGQRRFSVQPSAGRGDGRAARRTGQYPKDYAGGRRPTA
jgi:hypothetical protein